MAERHEDGMRDDRSTDARLPLLNEPAPPFRARTTKGEKSLDDYRGRWLVFFAHPADFTPVCASEFIAFSKAYDAFQALDCDLLGLSVDSLFSHIAWVSSIHDRFGVEVPFPIVEDPSMAIARAYGMLHPGADSSATVRASLVIDPNGLIRAITWYPMNVGRNVEELLRLVSALQLSEREQVFTPAGWTPGDAVLAPPPLTAPDPKAWSPSGEQPDWYYRLEAANA
ncbi:peroxiredoxin [Acidomonas methanolica]|uniref:peroxiredoxin n=1 Tax=Acidomonas methanolica TaxID=437 RepID=UPI00211A990F